MSKVASRIVAIDIDPAMLDVARDQVTKSGATNCEFVEGDAYEVAKLTCRKVDFVFLANTFHGVADKPRLAQAVGTALKSGGRFSIVNWHQRPREDTVIMTEPRGPKTELRMSPEQTIKSVEAGGLIFVNLVELPPYHYGVTFERSC
jgi:ubiquinone/menaquinone biosynthesis C-methylase UbiE